MKLGDKIQSQREYLQRKAKSLAPAKGGFHSEEMNRGGMIHPLLNSDASTAEKVFP